MYGYGYGMGYGYGYGYSWTYLLVIIGLVISLAASAKVRSTYSRYAKVRSKSGITAAQAAQTILQGAGIYDVRIERVNGSLTDHYSPKEKVLRLSDSVYSSTSVAAIGVAAHECGHAIQHAVGYSPLKLRSAAVPVANIGSNLYWPIILLGLLFSAPMLTNIGIILFCFVVLFQVITLPVEFNASRRALAILNDNGILEGRELSSARKVLSAAAMTYVAAVLSALLQLFRLLLLSQRNRRD